MERAFTALKPKLRGSIHPEEIMHTLSTFRDELAAQWIGTETEPGVITRLAIAGMAAGNHALEKGKSDNPVKAEAGITVDWTLLNKQAYEFAQGYIYDLIRGLDDTTRNEVQNAISHWIQTGDPLSVLESSLENIFHDAARAASIAQTESTRVYNEGAKQRWSQVGVKRAKWQTVNDSLTCPICLELHNQEFDLSQGAWSDILDKYVQAPAHVNCRCFARPIIEDVSVEDLPADVKPESETLTTSGYMPLDTGTPGKTVAALNQFLKQSQGALAKELQNDELNLLELNWDTDEYTINRVGVKEAAKRFVAESQDIQYGKDYLISLVQQDLAEQGIEINEDTAEQIYNDYFANRAEAIYTASQAGDVKLTEAQERRLKQAMSSEYLDMVYTTDTSIAGSLANQTKRKVSYGGNFYTTDAAKREARKEFLDRMGFLDTGG
jgi:SPP1 gp7 family putative phage head morphogenesis protein